MALNPKTSAASRNLALNAAYDVLNSGKFKGYDSTQPTDADTALGSQVKLFELAFASTAFAAASAGSKAAASITQDSSADAAGTLAWATCTKSDDTRVLDMSAGTSGANLNMNSVAIASLAVVQITALTITQAAG